MEKCVVAVTRCRIGSGRRRIGEHSSKSQCIRFVSVSGLILVARPDRIPARRDGVALDQTGRKSSATTPFLRLPL